MLTWIIEPDVFQDTIADLVGAIERHGHRYRFVPAPRAVVGDGSPTVAYGSVDFVKAVASEGTIEPGVFVSPQFHYTTYSAKLGGSLLNSQHRLLTYGEIDRHFPTLFPEGAASGPVFARPDSWDKSFAGTLLGPTTFEADLRRIGFYDLDPDTPVVLAPFKPIRREWRLVIVADAVVAACRYDPRNHRGLSPGAPDRVMTLARSLIAAWQPDSIYVMDVCETEDDDLRLLELNPFNSCDLYLCDRDAVVTAIADEVRRARP